MPKKHLHSLLGVINPQSKQSVNANDDEDHLDPMYQTSNTKVPIKQKDSALNICALNIRSLTISDKSVKLKRLFRMEH